jgi:hypothetical protein
MPVRLIDIEGLPILGQRERLPDLVEWATKGDRVWVCDNAFGLRLVFSSKNSSLRTNIYWNNGKFLSFREGLGTADSLRITCFGVEVRLNNGRLHVSLPNGEDGAIVLWDSQESFTSREARNTDKDDNFYWLAGSIEFKDDGPYFYKREERTEDTEEVPALAIIRKNIKQVKLSDAPLPGKTTLTYEKLRGALTEVVARSRSKSV